MFTATIDTDSQARLNINFIDFVVFPLYKVLLNMFPSLKFAITNMKSNRKTWEKYLPDG